MSFSFCIYILFGRSFFTNGSLFLLIIVYIESGND